MAMNINCALCIVFVPIRVGLAKPCKDLKNRFDFCRRVPEMAVYRKSVLKNLYIYIVIQIYGLNIFDVFFKSLIGF